MEIRRSYDRLISTMELPILVRRHIYIELGPSPMPTAKSRPQTDKQRLDAGHQYGEFIARLL